MKRICFLFKFRTFEVVLVINIPAEIVTALTWIGPNLDILLVTTWSKAFDTETGNVLNQKLSPDSGKIFEITGLGTKGVPTNSVCI